MMWLFGPFVFDPRSLELGRDGAVVPLQAQPARVLALLLERAGDIVTREEIRAHIWGETHVDFDRSLNFCIRRIRAALGEDASAPLYLQTLPRRGYRWIAPARPCSAGAAGATAEPPAMRRSTRWRSRGLAGRSVPLWAASAVTLASVLGALTLQHTVEPASGFAVSSAGSRAIERVTADHPSRFTLIVNALHTLGHAVVDGRQTPASRRALRTLEVVALSQVGLASDADLPSP